MKWYVCKFSVCPICGTEQKIVKEFLGFSPFGSPIHYYKVPLCSVCEERRIEARRKISEKIDKESKRIVKLLPLPKKPDKRFQAIKDIQKTIAQKGISLWLSRALFEGMKLERDKGMKSYIYGLRTR